MKHSVHSVALKDNASEVLYGETLGTASRRRVQGLNKSNPRALRQHPYGANPVFSPNAPTTVPSGVNRFGLRDVVF